MASGGWRWLFIFTLRGNGDVMIVYLGIFLTFGWRFLLDITAFSFFGNVIIEVKRYKCSCGFAVWMFGLNVVLMVMYLHTTCILHTPQGTITVFCLLFPLSPSLLQYTFQGYVLIAHCSRTNLKWDFTNNKLITKICSLARDIHSTLIIMLTKWACAAKNCLHYPLLPPLLLWFLLAGGCHFAEVQSPWTAVNL